MAPVNEMIYCALTGAKGYIFGLVSLANSVFMDLTIVGIICYELHQF